MTLRTKLESDLEAILEVCTVDRPGSSSTGSEPIEVVLRLQPQQDELVDSPEVTRQVAEALLDRVEARLHERPAGYNVFANLGSVAVAASRGFVSELAQEPEVRAILLDRSSSRL
jgi:hypothetical protein